MFFAQDFFNSFAWSVQEAGLACRAINPPLALRRARRLSRRPPPPFSRCRVKMDTATTSAPAIIDEDTVMSFCPAGSSSSGEDGFFSSPPPPKRRCFSPPTTAKCATTMLWRASAFNAIVEVEKEKVRAFYKANTTTICFSIPGADLSVVVKKDKTTWKKLEQIAQQVSALGVGVGVGVGSATQAPKKRPLEVF
ncbi:unnamed protein product [Mucor hiemalis]